MPCQHGGFGEVSAAVDPAGGRQPEQQRPFAGSLPTHRPHHLAPEPVVERSAAGAAGCQRRPGLVTGLDHGAPGTLLEVGAALTLLDVATAG